MTAQNPKYLKDFLWSYWFEQMSQIFYLPAVNSLRILKHNPIFNKKKMTVELLYIIGLIFEFELLRFMVSMNRYCALRESFEIEPIELVLWKFDREVQWLLKTSKVNNSSYQMFKHKFHYSQAFISIFIMKLKFCGIICFTTSLQVTFKNLIRCFIEILNKKPETNWTILMKQFRSWNFCFKMLALKMYSRFEGYFRSWKFTSVNLSRIFKTKLSRDSLTMSLRLNLRFWSVTCV